MATRSEQLLELNAEYAMDGDILAILPPAMTLIAEMAGSDDERERVFATNAALVLACGAWERLVTVDPGIDEYERRGLEATIAALKAVDPIAAYRRRRLRSPHRDGRTHRAPGNADDTGNNLASIKEE